MSQKNKQTNKQTKVSENKECLKKSNKGLKNIVRSQNTNQGLKNEP